MTRVNISQKRSTEVIRGQQKSTKVSRSQQKSTEVTGDDDDEHLVTSVTNVYIQYALIIASLILLLLREGEGRERGGRGEGEGRERGGRGEGEGRERGGRGSLVTQSLQIYSSYIQHNARNRVWGATQQSFSCSNSSLSPSLHIHP